MRRIRLKFSDFMKAESSAGVFLMFSAVLAMIIANTPLNIYYDMLITLKMRLGIGSFLIDKPLLLWVNDGLMAVFFFLVGLELKRELFIGELSDKSRIAMPAFGAIGGMIFPAIIYCIFNWGNDYAMRGWAIPAATDIAFALGILTLLGSRVPLGVKVLLTSLAIFDDIGAIIIIALFYTESLSMIALGVAVCLLLLLAIMNRAGYEKISLYVVVGALLWVALLKSGIHATLAGVLLAMFIPLNSKTDPGHSPLEEIEHDLHGAVSFFVLPLFAFCNSGIDISDATIDFFFHSIPLGIALGLFFGKQIGVFVFIWLGVKLGISKGPKGFGWLTVYGMSALCGIGFTMSLFIGSLAFNQPQEELIFDERLGIVIGSLLSGILGYCILKKSLPGKMVMTSEE